MDSKFWTIFFLIIFFPLGLFLMWKHGHFTKQVRVIITLFFVIIVLLTSCFSGANSAQKEDLIKKEQQLKDKEKNLVKLEKELKEKEQDINKKIEDYEKNIEEQNEKLKEQENERKKQEEIKKQEELQKQEELRKQEEQKKVEEAQKQEATQPTSATTTAPQQSVNFRNCKEAKAAGYSNIRRGEPGYSSRLDRDGDGIACDR